MATTVHETVDKGPILLAATIAVYTLAGVAVFLRFLSRRLARVGYWWDDWLALMALVDAVTRFGIGKHAVTTSRKGVHNVYKALYILEITYAITTTLVKYSILCFYWRIFKVTHLKLPFYIMFGVVTAWFIAAELGAIFKCVPASSLWNPSVHGHCFDIRKFLIGTAVPNILTDIILLFMPLPFVWTLQITRAQRLAVTAVFLVGAFVTVVSVIRLVVWLQLKHIDPTWNFFPGVLWNLVEPNIAVVSACLPTMRPILRSVIGSSPQPSVPGKSSTASSAVLRGRWRGRGENSNESDGSGRMGGNGSFGGLRLNAAKGGTSKGGRNVYVYTRKLRKERESEGDLNLEERGAGRERGQMTPPVEGKACFTIYRRFGFLHAKLLLYKQDERRELEDELREMDKRDWKDDSFQNCLRSRGKDDAPKNQHGRSSRKELLQRIEKKTLEYGELLRQSKELLSWNTPSTRDYTSVVNWLDTEAPLSEADCGFIKEKQDLITLRPGREHAWLDAFVERILKAFHCRLIQEARGKTENRLLHYYTRERIETFVNLIITLVIFILLVVPVYLLFHISAANELTASNPASIGILMSFTLVFSIVLSFFTRAQRHEILAASAA
ncbi:MAG: hypothetical protein Q9187_005355 [Circinaria calcarea]